MHSQPRTPVRQAVHCDMAPVEACLPMGVSLATGDIKDTSDGSAFTGGCDGFYHSIFTGPLHGDGLDDGMWESATDTYCFE